MDFRNPYLLFLAVPGFVALFAANFVSDFPEIRDSQLPFVYFILSVFSLAPPMFVAWAWAKYTKTQLSLHSVLRSGVFILSTSAFALVVGLIVGITHTTDILSRSLRAVIGQDIIPIYSHNELVRELFSRMSSEQFLDGRFSAARSDPWGILPRKPFNANNRYARIAMNDMEGAYEGVVVAYHSGTDTPQVYLSPACRIAKNDDLTVVQGAGVWLNLERAISVEIIDARCAPCATAHETLNGRVGGKHCPYDTYKP